VGFKAGKGEERGKTDHGADDHQKFSLAFPA
jgi:hypothetical protein